MIHNKTSLREKIKHFKDVCREADLKLTHQRLEIFRELASATDHPSVEVLCKRLHQTLPTLSLDTVYRTIATFEKYGLAARIQTVESQARFEAEMEQHHHVICNECGEITDFQWSSFDTEKLPEEVVSWGRIDNQQITLHGVCEKCELKKNDKKG